MPTPRWSRIRFGLGLGSIPAILVLVVVFLFLVPAYVRLNSAGRAISRHDPVAARAMLTPHLKSHPNDAKALLLAAKVARDLGEYAEAERLITQSETAGGPSETIGFEGTLLSLCQGDFAGQEQGVKQLADRNDPRAAEAMLALAKGYFVAFRHGETTQICDRLIGEGPNPVAALILRGDVADISRKHDDAEKDYFAAVAAGPRNALARSALARFLTKKGQTREALAHFELATQFGATDSLTRLGHAKALSDDGQTDRAESALNESLAAHPENAEASVELARIALGRREPGEALPHLERALKADPRHRDATELAMVVEKELKRPAGAEAMAKRVAEMRVEEGRYGALKLKARDNGGDIPVRLSLGTWCHEHGRPVEAVTWLTEVLRIDPRNAAAHAGFAAYYDATGQPRRAAAHRSVSGQSTGARP